MQGAQWDLKFNRAGAVSQGDDSRSLGNKRMFKGKGME
jgi:hypothetical protein